MKKILSLILSILMIASLAACGSEQPAADENKTEEAAALKFGSAVYVAAPSATDASADANGTGKLDVTVAAVTVDADGKIVACALDTMSNSVSYTTEGKAVAGSEFKTKYELGKDYNMVAYGGATKEWFEQADAFEAAVAGKTLDEVKALVVDGYKAGDALVAAGCTISVGDFVGAVEKAYNAAAESAVTANDTLKVALHTDLTSKDASADANGSQKVSVYTCAAAVNAEGKIVKSVSDCVEVEFTFDTKGASAFDASAAVQSKREKGADYGMVAYGGAAKEWFEQADAFDAACTGKSAAEIAGLMGEDYKGNADVQAAGCTIYVSGLVAAATKI